MKSKLVLIFDNDSEVNGINKVLVFDNSLDAEDYLLSNGIVSVAIREDENTFAFETASWKGTGKAYWGAHNPPFSWSFV